MIPSLKSSPFVGRGSSSCDRRHACQPVLEHRKRRPGMKIVTWASSQPRQEPRRHGQRRTPPSWRHRGRDSRVGGALRQARGRGQLRQGRPGLHPHRGLQRGRKDGAGGLQADQWTNPFGTCHTAATAQFRSYPSAPKGISKGITKGITELSTPKGITKKASQVVDLQGFKKWSGGGSNSRPLHCERSALPTELPPQRAATEVSACVTSRLHCREPPRRCQKGRQRKPPTPAPPGGGCSCQTAENNRRKVTRGPITGASNLPAGL